MGQIVSDVTDVLDYGQAKKTAQSQRQKILQDMADNEKEKTNLIKKTLATQRAQYGASGRSARGMTEDAVLKRIGEEVALPYAAKRRANVEKLKSVQVKRPNLLKSLLSRFDELM